MDDIFAEAKKRVNRAVIEQYFSAAGAEWRTTSNGPQYFTLNPMRDDRSVGSFSISEDGLFHDFSPAAPIQSGDFITLLSHARSLAPIEAARLLVGKEERALPPPTSTLARGGGEEVQKLTHKEVAEFLSRCKPCEAHPYLARKGVASYGLYQAEDGRLVIPMQNTEGVWKGVQFIDSSGDKRMMLRTAVTGSYFTIGEPTSKAYVVEGYATGASVHRASGSQVFISFNAGNIGPVVRSLVKEFPSLSLVIVADNDENQAGQSAAIEAASPFGIPVVTPPIIGDANDYEMAGHDLAALLNEEAYTVTPAKVDPSIHLTTDLGAAELFVSMYRHAIRYNVSRNAWMVCRAGVWSSEDTAAMTPLIKGMLSLLGTGNEENRKQSVRLESAKNINAMLGLAAKEPGIPVSEEQLDKEGTLLPVRSGAIDLKTGKLVMLKPSMLMSKRIDIAYNPEATCPVFQRFLTEIFDADESVINFLQRWFGSCLSADMSAQVMVILYGSGANGKSTLVETLARILGPFAQQAPPDLLIAKTYGSGIPNDVAGLRGSRMVLATETEQNAQLAESKIKQMTGLDKVKVRFMRGEFFEFYPTWKMTMSTNHKPRIKGGDHGIWRRVALVPFTFTCPSDKADPYLMDKLWAEREGILAWMVRGAVGFFEAGGGKPGLLMPKSVKDATTEYRIDEDVIGRFLSEACFIKGQNEAPGMPATVIFSSVHKAFQDWAERENERAAQRMSSIAFSKALSERGRGPVAGYGNQRVCVGLVPKSMMDINVQGGTNE